MQVCKKPYVPWKTQVIEKSGNGYLKPKGKTGTESRMGWHSNGKREESKMPLGFLVWDVCQRDGDSPGRVGFSVS